MTNKKIYLLILFIIVSITFNVNAENYGGNLKIKMNKRPLTLNPIFSANQTEKNINKQIFDKLLILNSQGELSNNLIEFWESNAESTVFKFKLKKNVYFHPYKLNGKEIKIEQRKVTAADWKWSFEYLADPKNKSPYAGIFKKVVGYDDYQEQKSNEITGIKVIDDYQLQISLKDSYAPFIYNLAKEAAVVIPKKAVLESGQKFSLNPIGTGPFKFKNFANNRIKLTKNQNYWKKTEQQNKLPYLEQIEYYFDNSKNLNKNYQEFDLYQLSYDQLINYYHNNQRDENYNLKTIINNNLYFVAFDCRDNDIKESKYKVIKYQIKSSLNNDKFNQAIKLNNYIHNENMSDGFNFLNKISAKTEANSENEVNFSDNLKLKMFSNNSNLSLQISELLKTELKKFNVKLEVKNYNWNKYLELLKSSSQRDLFMMSYSYENKFEFIADNFYSKSEKNYFNYENRRIDNLIDYIKLTKNMENQNIAYTIMEEILFHDNPYLVIFKGVDLFLISEKLSNQKILDNIHTKDKLELFYFE
ncbi:MAG: hypothetical protein BHK79_04285 [Halanaerobium sp. MDAL1]|nr:MAG: hypothetical protein BHK79_04285 [Halanaerobium sp. MDAL1]